MKYSTKKSLLLALSLVAATPTDAFTPQLRPIATARALKRPLATPLMDSMHPDGKERQSTDPTPALFGKGNAMAAGAALVAALTMAPLPSDAAMSGGRMGGSSFRPSASRSFSAPSARSYSQGYSSGYYSRPRTTIMPLVAPISPFYSPYGYGSPGVVTYNRGPGILPILVLGGMALAVSNVVNSFGRNGAPMDMFEDRQSDSVLGSGTSVVKMSVALDVPDRDDPNSILAVLERLANTAKTDSRMGIQNLSSQIALELLRRKSSIVSASSDYQHFQNREKAQREFNSMSIQERGKFEQEAISKFGGVDYGTARSSSDDGGFNDKATKAVVTLVLAIDGDSTQVPAIRSMQDVEMALRKISADATVSDCLQGAEILWTPEERSETLTMRDVIADYPELNAV
jgi:uncharacterized membrane protein